MKRIEAEQIIVEAVQDKRLRATINTRIARAQVDQGFRVDLVLRSRRLSITIKSAHEWEDIQQAWDGL